MTKAYYLNSIPGHHGSFDRTGGLPTHEPPTIPICRTCREPMAFLAQLYSDLDWSWPGDYLCLHIYQCRSDGCHPLPVLVPVPRDAPLNLRFLGRRHPLIARRDIFRELHEDPAEETLTLESELPFVSKLGGSIGPYSGLDDGVKFLGRLLEDPFDFNFATRSLLFYLSASGEIACDLQ